MYLVHGVGIGFELVLVSTPRNESSARCDVMGRIDQAGIVIVAFVRRDSNSLDHDFGRYHVLKINMPAVAYGRSCKLATLLRDLDLRTASESSASLRQKTHKRPVSNFERCRFRGS